MFTRPFTWELWIVTRVILIYTMLATWYPERESNPEFDGNCKSKRNSMKIGCDGDSFVRSFPKKVEKFKPKNIINATSEYKYEDVFQNKSIATTFLELPYEKVFISETCKSATDTLVPLP
uniref:Uncharacterized protein n=1 Tax=Cajanus cajan TaxID=3821 RepID=A0A151SAX1_CAJCA|nr:hypothetical protein KK1_026258 [Cajanus cajan]